MKRPALLMPAQLMIVGFALGTGGCLVDAEVGAGADDLRAEEVDAQGEADVGDWDTEASDQDGQEVVVAPPEPALCLAPEAVDFGFKPFGGAFSIELAVESCGDADLVVEAIGLRQAPGDSEDFSLDLSGFFTDPGAKVVLEPGTVRKLTVTFVPDEIGPADVAAIVITSNASEAPVEVPVTGVGASTDCPTAVIQVKEGEEVTPQTKLHLSGDHSFSAAGPLAKFQWSVSQPPGSASLFLPSASAPNPIFEVNVAGTYVFYLDLWDDTGQKSCETAQYVVHVGTEGPLAVEMIWNTPGDPDAWMEPNAQLQLHALAPEATGGLDVDGDGGADGWFGPGDAVSGGFWALEASAAPVTGTWRVAVHGVDDGGHGESVADVRVFVAGSLVVETSVPGIGQHTFCEVAEVELPAGVVTSLVDASGQLPCWSGIVAP